MRRKNYLRGASRLLSLLLVLSLLSGLCAQTALAREEAPDEPELPTQEQAVPPDGGAEPAPLPSSEIPEETEENLETEPPAPEDPDLPPETEEDLETESPAPEEPDLPPVTDETQEPEEPDMEEPVVPEDPELSEVLDTLQEGTYELDEPEAGRADKNILAFALREAQRAARAGLLEQLVSSAPADLKVRFENAVLAADEVFGNGDATYDEIQAAYLELQAVIWKLSYVQADKTALQLAVDNAAAINLSGYTASSAQALREALEKARALLARDDLHMGYQAEIAAAVQALKNAVNGLVKEPGSGGNTGGSTGGNTGGSTGGNTSGSSGGSSRPTPTPKPTPTPTPTPKPEESKNPQPSPGPGVDEYNDVPSGVWYAEGVDYVSRQGIMRGTGNGQFSPDMTVSRAMVWTMLYRLDGEPPQSGADSRWYAPALLWAQGNGVSDGANPEGGITREQLAVMFYRYVKGNQTTHDLSRFNDSDAVSDWAMEAMMWAVENGLINGKDGGRLDPQGTATRAEAAVLFTRFMQLFQNV